MQSGMVEINRLVRKTSSLIVAKYMAFHYVTTHIKRVITLRLPD